MSARDLSSTAAPGFGVYIHVPFCRHRCDYCAFATWTDKDGIMERYVDAVCTHIARERAAGMAPADTVFVGGGTPTRLPDELLVRILDALDIVPGAEVTVECNPDDVDEAMMRAYVAAGVSRVSIGVQSMVPSVLAALGRTHDPDNVEAAVHAARAAGIGQVNLDLIYGGHGETLENWRTTLERAIGLAPDHVSAYGLTVEAGTPLAADTARHPDDDDLADKYTLADDLLTAAGYGNYEISNWAKPGAECRHNRIYWSQGNYAAFGCAAHGHRDGRRWWTARTPERYIEMVERGEDPLGGEETLDAETRAREALELALRMRDGVPAGSFDAADLASVLEGLVEPRGDRLVLTRRGRLLANEVSLRFRP
jgi:oxygen-independent coproporphyrinogen-3 oxidase